MPCQGVNQTGGHVYLVLFNAFDSYKHDKLMTFVYFSKFTYCLEQLSTSLIECVPIIKLIS